MWCQRHRDLSDEAAWPYAHLRVRREMRRSAEARELLAPVYGWFAEGFETADLKNAKALLEALDA
jgi:predicted ATPase